MPETIGVDCVFEADGSVRLRRVRFGEQWRTVEQGRQWKDEAGLHILIMTSSEQTHEIVLSAHSLRWTHAKAHGSGSAMA